MARISGLAKKPLHSLLNDGSLVGWQWDWMSWGKKHPPVWRVATPSPHLYRTSSRPLYPASSLHCVPHLSIFYLAHLNIHLKASCCRLGIKVPMVSWLSPRPKRNFILFLSVCPYKAYPLPSRPPRPPRLRASNLHITPAPTTVPSRSRKLFRQTRRTSSCFRSLKSGGGLASEDRESEAIATRKKEGRKEGRKERRLRGSGGESQSNPFFPFPSHPSYPSDAVSLSLSLFLSTRLFRSSAFCPAPVFDPFSCRFGGLTITNIAGAIPPAPAPARLCGRQNNGPRRARGAGRRGALLIKYLKQSMKANKKCHVGVGSGAEREGERERAKKERQNWAVLSVCLPPLARLMCWRRLG